MTIIVDLEDLAKQIALVELDIIATLSGVILTKAQLEDCKNTHLDQLLNKRALERVKLLYQEVKTKLPL